MKRTSNPLRQQLAFRQNPGPHPDANLLTAFAEDALLPRERADVLAHLAACSSCREVLHVATAASEPLPAQTADRARPAHAPFRIWLGGFALACCLLALIGSVFIFEHALRSGVTRGQVSLIRPAPVATAPPPPAVSESPATRHAPVAPHSSNRPASPKGQRTSAGAPPAQLGAVPSIAESVSVRPEEPQIPTATPSASGLIPESSGSPSAPHQNDSAVREPSPASTQHSGARSFGQSRSFAKAAPRAAVGALMARTASVQRWRLGDDGQIEQLTSSGTWQPVTVCVNVKFRVFSVSGPDLWAGGDHLALFHSTDNGATWSQVHLPATADSTRAITDIRVDSLEKITVQTGDGLTWTTTDAGQTWQ